MDFFVDAIEFFDDIVVAVFDIVENFVKTSGDETSDWNPESSLMEVFRSDVVEKDLEIRDGRLKVSTKKLLDRLSLDFWFELFSGDFSKTSSSSSSSGSSEILLIFLGDPSSSAMTSKSSSAYCLSDRIEVLKVLMKVGILVLSALTVRQIGRGTSIQPYWLQFWRQGSGHWRYLCKQLQFHQTSRHRWTLVLHIQHRRLPGVKV